MIYTDLEGILDDTGIENKYALAMVVATRARQLSERRSSIIDGGAGSEQCISRSLEEVEGHELNIGTAALEPEDA